MAATDAAFDAEAGPAQPFRRRLAADRKARPHQHQPAGPQMRGLRQHILQRRRVACARRQHYVGGLDRADAVQEADLLVTMPAEPEQRLKAALAHHLDHACLEDAGALQQRAQAASDGI